MTDDFEIFDYTTVKTASYKSATKIMISRLEKFIYRRKVQAFYLMID